MTFKSRLFRAVGAAALLASGLAACDDPIDVDPLIAPSGLATISMTPTTVNLIWNQVPDADSYEIDRALGAAGTFANITTGITQTAYQDTGLAQGTEYRYQVRAIRSTEKGPSSSVLSVTTPIPGAKVATITGVTQNRTLFADSLYILSGYVKVSNNATLTIQAGTKIVGDTLTAGSSLWILRGSKLMANGTAALPIVFTSQREAGKRAPGDWGGIVMVGNAPINRTATPIFTEGPTGAAENYAGGTSATDNSGTLTYVRIEFAGYDVSNGGGQELNSISMYSVGSGTTLDFVQSMAGLDDSFEWFGGAADVKHLVSFESGDDHFDWTEGYRGRGQFLIGVQTSVIAPRPGTGTVSGDPRGFEGDGCEVAKAGCVLTNSPRSMPVFTNFTLVGPGTGVFSGTDGNGSVVRRGSGGFFLNGVIARWPGVGVSVPDADSGTLMDVDSLYFRNIALSGNGSNFEPVVAGRFGSRLSDNATAWSITTPALGTLFGALPTKDTAVTATNLGVQPAAGSPAASGGLASFAATPFANRLAGYFGATMAGTTYLGAVDPAGTPWYSGWTNFARN